MSTVFDSVDIKGLRVTHFEQLLSYVHQRENDEWYYGNKKQFKKRHDEIKNWLCKVIDYANSEGVIIPKAKALNTRDKLKKKNKEADTITLHMPKKENNNNIQQLKKCGETPITEGMPFTIKFF